MRAGLSDRLALITAFISEANAVMLQPRLQLDVNLLLLPQTTPEASFSLSCSEISLIQLTVMGDYTLQRSFIQSRESRESSQEMVTTTWKTFKVWHSSWTRLKYLSIKSGFKCLSSPTYFFFHFCTFFHFFPCNYFVLFTAVFASFCSNFYFLTIFSLIYFCY